MSAVTAAKTRKKTPMSAEHKAALAKGREEGRIVRQYLEALESTKPRRGRKRTPDSIKKRLAAIESQLPEAEPLNRLHLVEEKQRLEELTQRQEDVERGRNEIADKLTRSIILVQRETEEAQRRLEQLNTIQDSFAEHLRNLEEINPKAWNGRDLPRELTRALGTVDEARSAYARSHAKIAPIGDSESGHSLEEGSVFSESGEQDFAFWLRSGVAFTLPLLVLGSIALLVWIWHLMTAPR